MTTEATRAELAALVSSLRAHAEWQRVTGATGLPRADDALRQQRLAVAAGVETEDRGLARDETAVPLRAGESAAVDRSVPARHAPPDADASPPPEAPPRAASEHASIGTPDEARVRLATLEAEVRDCTRCGLSAHRTQTVFARGDGSSRLCFVGEGPGADEDAQGYPFVGKAGQLLDRMIGAMGFSRDEVYVCNIVKCRPPKNRKPEPDEMAACRPYVEEQLELVAPEVIVALGATAVQGLLGVTGGITRLRGEWRLYKGRIPVMPTFHPAYLLRQPGAKRDVWNDLQAVLTHMGRTPPARR